MLFILELPALDLTFRLIILNYRRLEYPLKCALAEHQVQASVHTSITNDDRTKLYLVIYINILPVPNESRCITRIHALTLKKKVFGDRSHL